MATLRRGVAQRYADGTPDVQPAPTQYLQQRPGYVPVPLTLEMERRAAARNAAGTPGTIEDTMRDRAELQRSPEAIQADFAQSFPDRIGQVQDQQRIFGLQQAAGQTPGGDTLENAQRVWQQQHAAAQAPSLLQRGLQAINPISSASAAEPGAPAAGAPAASGIGQLLTGQPTAALQNPESSQATRAIAGFMNYAWNAHRVRNLASPVSPADKLINMFAGNPASDAAIAQRDATAATFQHPFVQQHLMDNPDHLAAAEQDPAGYAQNPDFKQYMQTAVDNHNAAHDPQGIPHPGGFTKVPGNPPRVANVATTTGATLPQALAGTEPHQYTRDEFIKATEGMTMRQAQLMFGPQLAHVQTPQEGVVKTLFGTLTGDYTAERLKSQQLIEAGKTLTGSEKTKNAAAVLEQQKIEQQKRDALINALSATAGVTQKQFPLLPGQIQ